MTDNKNIVLIGMPSAGKTAVGSRLAKLLGRRYEDMDGRLEERFGITIAEYFTRFGEASFRAEEKKLACELALESGLVIATGGGIVKDPDNMRCLAENGIIVWLDRSVGLLRGTPDRPLSPDDESVRRLYAQRLPLYEKYADIRICADAGPYDVAAYTAQALKGYGTAEGPFFPKLPPDKALSHRALIAAYLAGDGCRLFSVACNDDVNATKAALEKFGAAGKDGIVIDCGESASTLRFLLPLFAQSGKTIVFTGKGRLLSRPLGIYEELYDIRRTSRGLEVSGTLRPGTFTVPGNISSQLISGLLFVLPLLDGDSVIEILPPFCSAGYVELTVRMLKTAGIDVRVGKSDKAASIVIPGRQKYEPFEYTVPADWSAAAALAVLSFLTGKDIKLSGTEANTAHPDRAIIGLLEKLKNGAVEADISDCPDIGPLLFAAATQAEGTSVFRGAGRLRLKESDRIASMQEELARLGCSMTVSDGPEGEEVSVTGPVKIRGGARLSSHGDHRVAIALSVLASVSEKPVILEGAECVSKSWPDFFKALENCGINAPLRPL